MAEKRMFSMSIMDSDAFLEMPLSSQALYVHLGIRADDDGFVRNPKKIQRSVGCADDDLKILVAKKFIIPFESGVVVIKHWHINNYIRKDRYKPTVYQEECRMLYIKPNRAYTLDSEQGLHYVNHKETVGLSSGTPIGIPDGTPDGTPVGIPDGTPVGIPSGTPNGIPGGDQVVNQWYTQNRIDKNRVDKNRVESSCSSDDGWLPPDESVSPKQPQRQKKFVKPSVQEIQNYIREKGYTVDAEAFYAYYESNGWMVGKNHMKDWKSALITWQKKEKRPSFGKPINSVADAEKIKNNPNAEVNKKLLEMFGGEKK